MTGLNGSNMNPVKRERKRLGLTIEDMCARGGFSKTFIIKSEQGAYDKPSERLLAFFRGRSSRFDSADFIRKYRDWQALHRKENYGLLTPGFPLKEYLARLPKGQLPDDRFPVGPVGTTVNEPYPHPFEFWRMSSTKAPNLNQISKAFCIHQGLLFKFEHQSHLVNSVPEPIFRALIEAGYERSTLSSLELAFSEFKQYMRNLTLRVQDNGTIRRADTTAQLL
jgi:transcriptional regulator with XRE-family HTH domain